MVTMVNNNNNNNAYREWGPEVVDAPGDDDIVIAAHNNGHNTGSVSNSL